MHSLQPELADGPHLDLLLQVFDSVALQRICEFLQLHHVIGIARVENVEIKAGQCSAGDR